MNGLFNLGIDAVVESSILLELVPLIALLLLAKIQRKRIKCLMISANGFPCANWRK
jgi:hypothetical protein